MICNGAGQGGQGTRVTSSPSHVELSRLLQGWGAPRYSWVVAGTLGPTRRAWHGDSSMHLGRFGRMLPVLLLFSKVTAG